MIPRCFLEYKTVADHLGQVGFPRASGENEANSLLRFLEAVQRQPLGEGEYIEKGPPRVERCKKAVYSHRP